MFDFLRPPNPYLDDPDVKAMLEVKAGHTQAFNLILEKHYQRIFQFCYRHLNANKHLAQDLTQEVFLHLYQMAPRYEPKAKITTLLFQMARHSCINQSRRATTVSLDATQRTDEGEMVIAYEDEQAPIASQELVREELAQAVRAAINELPEAQRAAILWQRYEQMSYEEIAQVMGTTPKAVKSLLNRAKENLSHSLSRFLKP